MKNLTCAILTISTILTTSTSAVLAGGNDTGNIQNNSQTSVTTGSGNTTVQQSRQINKMNRRNGSRGNDVNVQDSDQLCDGLGDYNTCVQESTQKNTVRRNGRRNRPSHK